MSTLFLLLVKKEKAYCSSSSFIRLTFSERIVKKSSEGIATQRPSTVVTRAWEIPPAIRFGSLVPDKLMDRKVSIIPDTVPKSPSSGETIAINFSY